MVIGVIYSWLGPKLKIKTFYSLLWNLFCMRTIEIAGRAEAAMHNIWMMWASFEEKQVNLINLINLSAKLRP